MNPGFILTTYNREPHILETCVRSIENLFPDSDIIIVDDGSDSEHKKAYKLRGIPDSYFTRISTIDDCPGTYHINGCNNPAHAFNTGVEVAKTLDINDVFIVSSDVIVSRGLRWAVENIDPESTVWTPSVVDTSSGEIYVRPSKVRPLPWCLYTSISSSSAIGGWDTGYLRGLAFEDNDFSARLCQHVGRLIIDGHTVVYHQSHPQVVFSDNCHGWSINESYTRSKWSGGIPFSTPNPVPYTLIDTVDKSYTFSFEAGA